MKDTEKYIAVCKKHWSCMIWPGFIAFILVVAALGSIGHIKEDGPVIVVLLIIAAIVIVRAIVIHKTEYIALTKTKVVGHRGFIRSKTLTTPISKIQNVGISNGLLGKILGYHTVTLSDAGGSSTEYVFKKMANAKAFADAVQQTAEQ